MTGAPQKRSAVEATAPGDAVAVADWSKPRPAALIMRPERLAAALPNALSFTRTLFDRFYETAWTLSKVRVILDDEGRGEVLYRLSNGSHVMHFLVLSNAYSTEQKADRSYNMNWDATAALCEGEWNEAREDFLRREIPKQRFGRLDHETLAYTRGNRSGRIFDYVVDCLADGRQPDGAQLAHVGYIFRTTGFTANGFIGMRSYLGLEDAHPLRAPYHAQMCSAFLLREYVSDLVDAMAAARSASAIKLSPAFRRYLGIGNSAGLGLTPFIYNHPRMVHHWTSLKEHALADARRQLVRADSAEVQVFRNLLARAKRYFTEDPRNGNGVFLDYPAVAEELSGVIRWTETALLPTLDDRPSEAWIALSRWAEDTLHPETIEVLNTIIIELYPGLRPRYIRELTVDETLDVDATMTIGDLGALIGDRYAWALACFADMPQAAHNFWYMSTEAPYEPRRGKRGICPDYEFEGQTDAPLRLAQLMDALKTRQPDESVAAFLCEIPGFRNIVARLCSLAECDYAELRENTLERTHTTFGSVRFMLSHYGMDKLDAQPPRSVKGVLLQGAPIGDDLPSRRPGEWPFALVPQEDAEPPAVPAFAEAAQKGAKELTKLEVWKETTFGEHVIVAPVEIGRWSQRALQARGAELGVAIAGARLVQLRETLSGDGVALALELCHAGPIGSTRASLSDRASGVVLVESACRQALALAPNMLDLACHGASRGQIGAAVAFDGEGLGLLEGLPIWADERGHDCILLWRAAARDDQGRAGWHVRACASNGQAIFAKADLPDVDAIRRTLLSLACTDAARAAIDDVIAIASAAAGSSVGILCFDRRQTGIRLAPVAEKSQGSLEHIDIAAVMRAAFRFGLKVRFDALESLKNIAFETLLPVEKEGPVATE